MEEKIYMLRTCTVMANIIQFDNVPDIKTLDYSDVSYTPSNDLG